MRVMLVSDLPPCRNYTAGLVLEQLLPCFESHDLCAAVAVDPAIDPQPADLIPEERILRLEKPRESRKEIFRRPRALAERSARWFERRQARRVREELLPRIVAFGKAFGVDKIWLVLEGQTMVRLARPLADALRVPLSTQIWDPFGWWLRANRIDVRTSRQLVDEFDAVIRQCDSVAAASFPMAARYREHYGVRAIPVIPGIGAEFGRQPPTPGRDTGDFIIGMAGQLYAAEEWRRLFAALESLKWRVAGRQVRLRVLGTHLDVHTLGRVHCEFLGWRDQAEVVSILHESDVNFLPYWFDPTFREESESSFPSKMSTYCAAAAPVLVHAPDYATPTAFVREHDIGYVSDRPSVSDLADAIVQAAEDEEARRRKAHNAAACFGRHLSASCMRDSFREFLRLPA